MAINFNTNPYYDDFDETDKFHRILFRPGYAVQARELTQLQTQLQDQIKKFGDHVFVNGSIVLGGQRTFQNDVTSIKLESSYAGQSVNINNFLNKTIVGQTSGTKAIVKTASSITSTDPITLIVKINSGGTFTAGEVITTSDSIASATIQLTSPFNDAMLFSVDSGIFFIDGNFVYTEAQTIAVDKYSNTSSKNIGFLVIESIVNSDADADLLDKAQGSPNYSAPGADRYKIALTLTSKTLGTALNNFIEIARVVNGELVVNKDKTIYSELGTELARRTFDESGDYTVKKWPIQLLTHQDTVPDPTKFTVGLDPGKGYIKGYEFETISQQFLTADRARDFEQTSSLDISTLYGNYVYVDTLLGEWNTSTTNATNAYERVNLYNGGTIIGTTNVRHIQWHSGTPSSGASTIYKMYLFNITMSSGSFANVTQIGTASISCQINELSKVGGSPSGASFVSGTDVPGLVFKFPNEYIKTVRDDLGASVSDYQAQREFSLTFAGGTASIASSSALERFVGTGALADLLKDTHYHVVFTAISNAGGTGYSVGNIAHFRSSSGRSITVGADISGSTQSLDFNLNAASFSGTAKLIATVNLNNQSEKTKTLSSYTYKIISSPNTTAGGTDTLAISDIYDVQAIYNTGTTNPTTQVSGNFNSTTGAITWGSVSNTNVTTNYAIDDGQRSEFYDHGGITLTGTAPGATDYIVVVYRHFTHSGNGFFSVDSYASIDYENIPVFNDPASGETLNLRDCIDFRPIRQANALTLDGGLIPDPDGTFNTDYQYYLARMDKVIATSDKQFVIQKGVPAVYPKVPSDLSNGMTLYVLIIPPYTADPSDVSVKYMDNKRYTMRDIGKLEKRINTLEYYTQLNLLEKQAKDTAISDASNLEKFKNGFVVDAFTSADIFAAAAPELWAQRRWGWWSAWFNGSNNWNMAAQNYNENSIANVANPDFNAAIDPINQELRPPFETDFYYFDQGTLVNTVRNTDSVSLSYTETAAIEQTLATTYVNVNPFNIIRFLGQVTLEPAFDQWVDTQNLPAVNRVVDVQLPDAADQTTRVATNNRFGIFRTTSRTSSVQTNVVQQTTSSLGANVVDIQFVPFMRANTTIGISNGFKPLSRLYGFIENTPIDSYLRPLTLVLVEDHNGALFDGRQGVYEPLSIRTDHTNPATQVGTAKTAIYSSPTTADPTRRLLSIYAQTGTISAGNFVVGTISGGRAEVVSVTTYSAGNALIPDEFGNLGFQFDIPANTFRTGERTIRLINNTSNDFDAQDSLGEAKYTAIGQLQTKQETLLTTRTLQRQRTTVERGFWYDPVAESFLVDPQAYPNGMHLSSVDVYFRTKSSTIPITMEIRRTVNGYPESQTTTIPFAITTLRPEQVSASTSTRVATKFSFPAIHLVPGEYAITLVTNSSDYEVYVAEMGKTLLDGTGKVDKQPYAGSLFKSQNASTWEADQNKDLMFVIRRAQFVTSGSAEFSIQDPSAIKDYNVLFANVNAIAPTGTTIKWYGKAYSGSTHDTDWAEIDINQDLEYTRMLKLDAAANASGIPTLRLKADLSTTSDQISPVIDVTSLSVVATENLINNVFTNETNPTGGDAIARYITKPVTLADGFDASNLNVTVDINRPAGTDVKIYYRALPSGSTSPITNENWILMSLESAIDTSTNSFDFREYRYFPSGAFDVYGVPNDDPITPRFNTFQVKIVMLSSLPQNAPKLRDLRIIALDS